MAVKLLLVLSLAVVAVSSAGILETLLSWDLHDTEGRSSTPQPKCLYQANGYLCCVDIVLTPGIEPRPACVNINQKNNNVTLNLSYADNPVHNATIKIEDAANKPTCMNLLANFGNFAHLCAKFTTVTKLETGHTGCLVIEPVLMGSLADTYSIGCFKFDGGVQQVDTTPIIEPILNSSNSKDTKLQDDEDDDDSFNTDELLAVVSESAEQGLALFSRWLGFKLNDKINSTTTSSSLSSATSSASPSTNNKDTDISTTIKSTSRSGRGMVLDNNPIHEDKSDERFKQLLSAQDNILKESEMIGNSDGKKTTFVYSQIPSDNINLQQQKNILPVVPRESRRGGRAYNIHQHINEI